MGVWRCLPVDVGVWEHATLLFCAGNCGEQDAQERRMMAMPWIDNYVCDEAAQTNAFDADLNGVDGLTWLPWVGCQYQRGGVLVVGESDYAMNDMATDDETPCEHITHDRQFVRKVIDRFGVKLDGHNPTIANIRRVLARDGEENGKTFTRVAFMDFCQRALSWEDDENPLAADFVNGLPVVQNVVRILEPDIVLFAGLAAAGAIQRLIDIARLPQTVNRCRPWVGRIEAADCAFIRHPGRYFSCGTWRDFLCERYDDRIVEH